MPITLTVPAGCVGGDKIQIELSTGEKVVVQIPAGLVAGQTFPYDPQAAKAQEANSAALANRAALAGLAGFERAVTAAKRWTQVPGVAALARRARR